MVLLAHTKTAQMVEQLNYVDNQTTTPPDCQPTKLAKIEKKLCQTVIEAFNSRGNEEKLLLHSCT